VFGASNDQTETDFERVNVLVNTRQVNRLEVERSVGRHRIEQICLQHDHID